MALSKILVSAYGELSVLVHEIEKLSKSVALGVSKD